MENIKLKDINMKYCRQCDSVKDILYFTKSKNNILRSNCKQCSQTISKQYYDTFRKDKTEGKIDCIICNVKIYPYNKEKHELGLIHVKKFEKKINKDLKDKKI